MFSAVAYAFGLAAAAVSLDSEALARFRAERAARSLRARVAPYTMFDSGDRARIARRVAA